MNLNERAQKKREKNFRYAVASSMGSKVTTVAVQIIAMPIAAISLGAHGFTLYALLMAAVGWLALSNLGIGPTLTVKLAAAHVHNDLCMERCIFSSAFIPVFIISAFVSLATLCAVWVLPVNGVFGPLYAADIYVIQWGLTILIIFSFLQTNLSLFESVQASFQEQYVQNLFATASSLPCILAILIVANQNPTPIDLILALSLPSILFRCINAAWVVRRHPDVFSFGMAFRWPVSKQLMQSGAMFSLAGGLGNFLAHILPVILVGRSFNSNISASFAATMNAVILVSGVISMLSTPLWPAIADSVARGDRSWAVKAYGRLLGVVMVFGLFVALFLAVRGEWLFQIWFRGQINPSRELLLAAGFYFVLSCWEVAHFTILVGLHKIAQASILVCMRAIIGVGITIVFLEIGNEAVPFIAMIFSIIVVDMLPMRRLVLRSFNSQL
jgi:O-antigen/teichoic acid export membrane protein